MKKLIFVYFSFFKVNFVSLQFEILDKMKRYIIIFVMLWGSLSLKAQIQPLFENDAFMFFANKIVQDQQHASVLANNAMTSTLDHHDWLQKADLSKFPTFECNIPFSNTLYNLAMDELNNLITKDSTLMGGKDNPNVRTKDLGFSALLATALTTPTSTKNSLANRVNGWRIKQDTGNGNSWPISTDRVSWILGAWQVYLITGDNNWLKRSYDITRATLMQDGEALIDPKTGLVRGECAAMDWRENVYPQWMDATDVAMSEGLSTNALFYRAYEIAARMANIMGDKRFATQFSTKAEAIKKGINEYLWLEDRGYYGEYLYGREFPIVSPRSETLGEALCIIFGIADEAKAQRIVKEITLPEYGMPCFSPQIPNGASRYNNAIMPMVQAYWLWASAIAGNQQAVMHGMTSMYRAAALNVSSIEYCNATTGEFSKEDGNASMLWSVAGNLSIAQRVLMGLHPEESGLAIRPFIPRDWAGELRMNIRYRKSVLQIEVKGFGDKVSGIYIDGKSQKGNIIPATLTGKHKVTVTMADDFKHQSLAKFGKLATSPEMVQKVFFDSRTTLGWNQVSNAKEYKIICNGKVLKTVPERGSLGNRYAIKKNPYYTEYQVIAIDSNGQESFASEPLLSYDRANEHWYDMTQWGKATSIEGCGGWTGAGAVEVSNVTNNNIEMTFDVKQTGMYRIDFRYANGSGKRVGSEECASRTLYSKDSPTNIPLGIIVMPQRGENVWDDWATTNAITVKLIAGRNTLVLSLEPENENMSAKGTNKAVIDAMRLVRVE